MMKLLIFGRRARGRTRAAAQAHLRDVHGRLVVLPPADAGAMPAYYAQNHVFDGAYPESSGPRSIERDLVTELDFADMAALRAAVSTPYYLTNLRPDEPRFVDDATVARVMVDTDVVRDGARGGYTLFVIPGPQADVAAMTDRLPYASRIAHHRNAGDDRGFAEQVVQAWFEDRAALVLAAESIDDSAATLMLAEAYPEERLRTLLA